MRTGGFVIVHSVSHAQRFATPWTATCQASLSFTISQCLLKLISTESVMPSNHRILCRPLVLLILWRIDFKNCESLFYSCDLYNIIHQLYFNQKKELKREHEKKGGLFFKKVYVSFCYRTNSHLFLARTSVDFVGSYRWSHDLSWASGQGDLI